ncbi:bacteriochlorophyll/chlorophyll a synthase [Roseovarius gaetbuli]|uniref:Bacteriochlorophyll/chlorophyll a synthase n=1 Tax=Roseovarius gaetbuli TaxID=1356575 RepID=A0A1X6YY86_9RHOB|nr:bacteriochlorophyll/chlorophyll a synthase [Roseovarius gaetbuli]
MSQAANDWCDRHVDAIDEPDRPIPSGRVPGRWGLWIALIMSAMALGIGALLGPWGFGATVFGVIAAWAYSAVPVRLKRSGIWGPGLVGLCYEGLPWFTGAAVLANGAPALPVVVVALLYALGAHGIMTLNDFKALEGRPPDGSQLSSGHAWAGARGARGVLGHGPATGGGDRAFVGLGSPLARLGDCRAFGGAVLGDAGLAVRSQGSHALV